MNSKLTNPHVKELVRDINDRGASPIENLPQWNLNDLYTGETSEELIQDLKWLEQECADFENDFKDNLEKLSSNEFLKCILNKKKIQNISGRIMSFAGLKYYQSTTDNKRAKFLADTHEKTTIFSSRLVFFSLEINSDEYPKDLSDNPVKGFFLISKA